MRRLCVVIGIMYLASAPAMAQLSFGDKGEPILVKAEKATYKGNKTLLEGKVDVRQGSARITSDEMEIYREKGVGDGETLSLGAVTTIVAIGNFRYTTPDETVTGERGTYKRNSETIIVEGNVRVGQAGQFRLTGPRLVYDLKTKRAKVGQDGQRVNIVLE